MKGFLFFADNEVNPAHIVWFSLEKGAGEEPEFATITLRLSTLDTIKETFRRKPTPEFMFRRWTNPLEAAMERLDQIADLLEAMKKPQEEK